MAAVLLLAAAATSLLFPGVPRGANQGDEAKASLIELGLVRQLRINPPKKSYRLIELDVHSCQGVALHETGWATKCAIRVPAPVVDIPLSTRTVLAEPRKISGSLSESREALRQARRDKSALRPAFPDITDAANTIMSPDPPFDGIAVRKPPVRRKQLLGRRRASAGEQ